MKPPLARGLYSAASYLLTPVAFGRLLIKSRKNPDYRSYLGERLGYIKKSKSGTKHLHFHAVSVGETLAAVPVIKDLNTDHPDWSFSISVTTPTGREQAQKHLSSIAEVSFLPFDLPDAVARFVNRINPDLMVLVETELWPNLINYCAKQDIPRVLINGRMSEKSAANYKKMASVTRPMMQQLDLVLAQFEEDAQRFVDLGCAAESVLQQGNLKFDIQLTEELRQHAKQYKESWQLYKRPVFIAASTHPGEEAMLLDQYQRLLDVHTDLLMILVPRHPDRTAEVEQLVSNRNISSIRRTQLNKVDDNGAELIDSQVLILDTLGELSLFYGLSDIAFVGGSLIEHGGHNPIEPALWGLPILTGTHCFNFLEITKQLADSGALVQCSSVDQLFDKLQELLGDSQLQEVMGKKSADVLKTNRGSLHRQKQQIESLLVG